MQYKIDWCEKKNIAKLGKDVLECNLIDPMGDKHERVTIWNDFPGFNDLMNGGAVEGEISKKMNGQYEQKTLYPMRPQAPQGGSRGAGMAKLVEKKAEAIEKAQDRKEDGIKLSATFRDAGMLTSAMVHAGLLRTEMDIKDAHRKWRTWLSAEYSDPTV